MSDCNVSRTETEHVANTELKTHTKRWLTARTDEEIVTSRLEQGIQNNTENTMNNCAGCI
jgi:hypothetical protein